MIYLFMYKFVIHNKLGAIEASNNKNFHKKPNLEKKTIVDINQLLNRVRSNKKKEKKEKLIFLSMGFLFLGIAGIFVLFTSSI